MLGDLWKVPWCNLETVPALVLFTLSPLAAPVTGPVCPQPGTPSQERRAGGLQALLAWSCCWAASSQWEPSAARTHPSLRLVEGAVLSADASPSSAPSPGDTLRLLPLVQGPPRAQGGSVMVLQGCRLRLKPSLPQEGERSIYSRFVRKTPIREALFASGMKLHWTPVGEPHPVLFVCFK